MDERYKYVIVGGGLAGASAVEGIRERDRGGSIALFGNENRLPYDRPPLSKGLWLGKSKEEELPVHDEAFYTSHAITLHLDNEVVDIDPSKRELRDKEGHAYAYEKLLLATGGSPRRLPFGADALHYFRTVQDYQWLKKRSVEEEEFILIGGGFIGVELAAALTLNSRKVTMIFPEQTLLQRILPADLSSFVTEYYRSRGVSLLNRDVPARAERQGRRMMLTTKSGLQLAADAAIAAIGLDLHVELAARAALKMDNGITVTDRLRSSDPDIYAAGDIANFPAASLDARMRAEHWNNAQSQGRLAGENMAGADKPYNYLPYFYSDLFDLGFEAVGLLDSRMESHAIWKEKFREGVVYYLDNHRVKGVLLWNVWGKLDEARAVISAKKEYARPGDLAGVIDLEA
jgi:3-phenylpropionate/trans-cinnamate dioxygenase ferredoxin reductase component